VARLLAESGYAALVVDQTLAPELERSPPTDSQLEYFRSMTFAQEYMRRTAAGVEWLRRQPFAAGDAFAGVGFCGGGWQLAFLATRRADLRALVAFYAPPEWRDRESRTDPRPTLLEFVTSIHVPVQFHYGSEDELIPLELVRRLEHRVREARLDAEIHVYEGAGHGFCDFGRPWHVPEAAELSFARATEFLSTRFPV
jgi:carboxymethylenebutenolidase